MVGSVHTISNLKKLHQITLCTGQLYLFTGSPALWGGSSFPKFSLSLDVIRFLKILSIKKMRNISFFSVNFFFLLICNSHPTYAKQIFSNLSVKLVYDRSGFSTLALLTHWAGKFCCGDCPAHCWMFGSNSGFNVFDDKCVPPYFLGFGAQITPS